MGDGDQGAHSGYICCCIAALHLLVLVHLLHLLLLHLLLHLLLLLLLLLHLLLLLLHLLHLLLLLLAENSGLCVISADAAFAAAAVPSSFSRCSCCCSFPCFFFSNKLR